MPKRIVGALALLIVSGRPADSHQLDEYLQATRIAIAADRIVLEIDLTPGMAVAQRVFTLLDHDGNGEVARDEIEAYAHEVLSDLSLDLDGRRYQLMLVRADCPPWPAMRDGVGTIRLQALAPAASRAAGYHRLRFENNHQPALGVYLVNALVPASRMITITRQQRDVKQRSIVLEFDVATPFTTATWMILPVVTCTALLTCRRRVRSSPRRRGAESPQR